MKDTKGRPKRVNKLLLYYDHSNDYMEAEKTTQAYTKSTYRFIVCMYAYVLWQDFQNLDLSNHEPAVLQKPSCSTPCGKK